jgi:UPF0755 protein
MKNIMKIILIFVVLSIIFFLYVKNGYDTGIKQPNSSSNETVDITIYTGESLDQIIEKLIANNTLSEKQKLNFKYYVRQNKLFPKFQAGEFRIPQNLTIVELAETLQKAGLPDFWVTIPEGLRKDQIADLIVNALEDKGNQKFSKDEFLSLTTNIDFIQSLGIPLEINDLEGFLYPDRYLFSTDVTSQEVIQTMVNIFIQKVPAGYTYEDIIIASYLEREGYNNEDRSLISDIIRRRMSEGWYLNIDATLLYYYKDWKHYLTRAELQTDHEYNTYTRTGFTPTPICNPGAVSITASLNPTPNTYYYYIHDKNGTAHYAHDIYEHTQNIQTYLQ